MKSLVQSMHVNFGFTISLTAQCVVHCTIHFAVQRESPEVLVGVNYGLLLDSHKQGCLTVVFMSTATFSPQLMANLSFLWKQSKLCQRDHISKCDVWSVQVWEKLGSNAPSVINHAICLWVKRGGWDVPSWTGKCEMVLGDSFILTLCKARSPGFQVTRAVVEWQRCCEVLAPALRVMLLK